MSEEEHPSEIYTLAQLRADIALTREFAFFQTGSLGPLPDSTQYVINSALREESGCALQGMDTYSALAHRAERARVALAMLLNVSPDQVAWTQNTSTAVRLGVFSLPWKAGDRLALSGTEHVSTRTLARGMEQTLGCRTTVIPVGNGSDYAPEDFICPLDRLLTPDHRLLIISHVSCLDGRRLPVVEAVRLAQRRGVKVLVDGAQSVGQFPIDVAAIGADFYAGSLHKWLLGPAGLGYLVVAQDQLPAFNPGLLPLSCDAEAPLSAADRSEVGTHSPSLRLGASHAVELLQRIGLDRIETHIRCLTERLRQGLTQIPGFEMLSPVPWELSSGITSLDFPGCSAPRVQELIDRIWEEYRVVVKFQTDFSGIRISVAAFNSEEEVGRLLTALAQLLPQM